MVHTLACSLIVRRLGIEDIGNESLRVAIDQREPGALDLHKDLVPLLEAVIGPVKVDRVFLDKRAMIGEPRRWLAGGKRGDG